MKQHIVNALMGLALMGAGGWLVYNEVSHPPTHNAHIYVYVGIAMLGALLVNPTPIIQSVKQVVVVIAPIIPWSKAQQFGQRLSGQTPVVPDLPPKGD